MGKGQQVFTFPEDLAKFAQIQPFPNTDPLQIVIDRRGPERKKDDLLGIQANTFKEVVGINVEEPTIVASIPEREGTAPSLTHQKTLGCIVLIMMHPEHEGKTLV